jgi:PBP1b-binding outer membrane lipoprotein LpoB
MIRELVIVLMLSGCATQEPIYVDRIVKVPEIVMEQCTPPPVVVPLRHIPLDSLNSESKHAEIARAYVKTVEIQKIKILQYKEALDAVTDESE